MSRKWLYLIPLILIVSIGWYGSVKEQQRRDLQDKAYYEAGKAISSEAINNPTSPIQANALIADATGLPISDFTDVIHDVHFYMSEDKFLEKYPNLSHSDDFEGEYYTNLNDNVFKTVTYVFSNESQIEKKDFLELMENEFPLDKVTNNELSEEEKQRFNEMVKTLHSIDDSIQAQSKFLNRIQIRMNPLGSDQNPRNYDKNFQMIVSMMGSPSQFYFMPPRKASEKCWICCIWKKNNYYVDMVGYFDDDLLYFISCGIRIYPLDKPAQKWTMRHLYEYTEEETRCKKMFDHFKKLTNN